jgi:mannose-6-phosphate isomerase-like protein (cupin superfamily)
MKTNNTPFAHTRDMLQNMGFNIVAEDTNRPWGGFFVIDEKQTESFAHQYFSDENLDQLKITRKLSPKILLVAPGKRLSWQYHHRRAEIWRCIDGKVEVSTSDTDIEKETKILQPGEKIKLQQGERHRLLGMDSWGIVAEIWQHTNEDHPSDEDDIVRLQDDFGR